MPLQTLYNHVCVQSDVLQEVPGLGLTCFELHVANWDTTFNHCFLVLINWEACAQRQNHSNFMGDGVSLLRKNKYTSCEESLIMNNLHVPVALQNPGKIT